MKISKPSRRINKKIAITGLVAIALVVGYGIYASTANIWPFPSEPDDRILQTDDYGTDKPNSGDSTNDNSTINSEAEEWVQGGGNSGQENSSSAGTGITDNGGENVSSQTGGVSSESGNVTVYSPTSNQKLSNGLVVKGAASNLSEVHYRLSDDVNGMIGSGRLTVNGGFFSGTVAANTSANSGRFEVFSLNNQGQEVNNVIIEIKY